MAAVAAAKGALAENSGAPQASPATASQFDAVDKPAIQQPTSAPQSEMGKITGGLKIPGLTP